MRFFGWALVCLIELFVIGCSTPVFAEPCPEQPPILIESPMDSEIEVLRPLLTDSQEVVIDGYHFYVGKLRGCKVVLVQTYIKPINAALATHIGIHHFKPMAVVSQGIAGGHDRRLRIGDLVIGERACYVESISTGYSRPGEGQNLASWARHDNDFVHSDGTREKTFYFECDPHLVSLAEKTAQGYTRGRVYRGTIASGFSWIRETDRILWANQNLGSTVVDMESAAVAQVCNMYQVPVVIFRTVSDNELLPGRELTGELEFDDSVAVDSQRFTSDFVSQLVEDWLRNHSGCRAMSGKP